MKKDERVRLPIATKELADLLATARDVHRHDKFPHILLFKHTDDSLQIACLLCGGSASLEKDGALDKGLFGVFKQFHMDCQMPKDAYCTYGWDEIDRK